MRKFIFSISFAIILLLSGCNQSAGKDSEITESTYAEVCPQSLLAEPKKNDTTLAYGWTTEAIRQNLVENSDIFAWNEIFGSNRWNQGFFNEEGIFTRRDLGFFNEESIFVCPSGYVLALAYFGPNAQLSRGFSEPDVFLMYTIIDAHTIDWEIIGFYFNWAENPYLGQSGLTLLPYDWQNRNRHITDAESVIVRFYNITEPYTEGLDFIVSYFIEEIPGEQLWEETIRLMEFHNGIEIWDFWYDEYRIYVDLKPMQWPTFTFGTTSFNIWASAVLLTFSSFPDVQEIQILFGGNDVHLDHHGSAFGYYKIGVGFPMSGLLYSNIYD